ncbi:hypothetical protein KP509_03G023400 [Ceratopteris richardii]|uniref:RING-type E3 ubiquitin transferase BRCA1 n=1 Tax=Ceratopteris richardii TaxID=49495 RepID=A0A8T2V1P2_CERRI|nr:hypothetical protein KP509_03G023400 [Ceratopteris richardii]
MDDLCRGGNGCGRIPQMGSVVASVTGYAGDDRSNLIKLINTTGANYVGKLLKGSTTHLVCHTFDGPKYEMAKRIGIHILNHRWFEDCLEAGKRLNEQPYTRLSGIDVGPVSWKPPAPQCSDLKHRNRDVPEDVSNDEIVNVSDDDHDLDILLQNKRGNKRKGKLFLAQKYPKRCGLREIHEGQWNYDDRSNRGTHNKSAYVSLGDDIKRRNSRGSRACGSRRNSSFEVAKERYLIIPGVTYVLESRSATILDSMRQRKNYRLLGKTQSGNTENPPCIPDAETMESARSSNESDVLVRTERGCDEPVCSTSPNHGLSTEEFNDSCSSPVVCTLVPADIACVICHTDTIRSAEGVLACGHHFCYQCIMTWASEAACKPPTCPLCKASFDIVTKRERTLQFCDAEASYEESVVVLPHAGVCNIEHEEESTPAPSCVLCGIGDMEELLLTCSGCGSRSAHSFCLDPPLPPMSEAPWFCGRCSQRRRADITWWHQLHVFED